MNQNTDTIAAIATAPGVGGVGIVRVSGPQAAAIAKAVSGSLPPPRQARFASFCWPQNTVFSDSAASRGLSQPAAIKPGESFDHGVVLYFPNPASFTGEDVVELHGHGGPVVMNLLLQACLAAGARLAEPGEFSQRAFLNGKIDLVQAEAIADLISSGSEQAALAAQRALSGEFSRQVHDLLEALVRLRVWVEAAIDFAEEEIDFLADEKLQHTLQDINQRMQRLLRQTTAGAILNQGFVLALAGVPNAGKSSLLNRLSRQDSAIVSEQAGTTRDVLKEQVQIQGIPATILDTAGLHDTDNPVEKEGIRRAQRAIAEADLVMMVLDASQPLPPQQAIIEQLPADSHNLFVINKQDLNQDTSAFEVLAADYHSPFVRVSATLGTGLDALQQAIVRAITGKGQLETTYLARTRHVQQLRQTAAHLQAAEAQLLQNQAGELVAEELRLAQQALNAITGEFTSDDLLGEIFSSFCIGK